MKHLNIDLNISPGSNVQVSQQLERPYHAARSFSALCFSNKPDVSLHRGPGTGQGRRHTVCARWLRAVAAAVRFEMAIFYSKTLGCVMAAGLCVDVMPKVQE